jgi:hypothetical protein
MPQGAGGSFFQPSTTKVPLPYPRRRNRRMGRGGQPIWARDNPRTQSSRHGSVSWIGWTPRSTYAANGMGQQSERKSSSTWTCVTTPAVLSPIL